MRSIEKRFKQIEKYNPYWSSYICFSESIKNQRFSKPIISRWFNKLVEKNDYDKKDKKEILLYLYNLSNRSEDDEI